MNILTSSQSLPKLILGSFLCIVLVIVGFSGYSYMKTKQQERAKQLLMSIEEIKNQEEKLKRLSEIEGTLPSHMATAIAMQLGNNALQEHHFEDAKIQYEKVAKTKDAIHIIGILGEARALIQLKQPLEAISLLQPFTHGLPDDITSLVLLTVAEAQEDANLISDAVKTYSRITTIDTNSYGYIQHKLQVLSNNL